MNYKFLFFSVNRHQKSYFDSLLSVIRKRDKKISLHKRSLIWLLPSLLIKKSDISLAYSASLIRLKYFHNKTGKRSGIVQDFAFMSLYYFTTLVFLLKIKKLVTVNHFDIIILWNDMKWHQFVIKNIASKKNIKVAFFENGTLPNTVTFDTQGVNFNNSVPKDKEFYLKKYVDKNLSSPEIVNLSEINEGYIFVPFQVDYDTQIISHSPWIKDMESFYEVLNSLVSTLHNGINIIIKEHPKSSRNYEFLHHRNSRIKFDNQSDTEDLVLNSELIITINSTVGLESIIKDKPVMVLGRAFYAIEGLCQKASSEAEVIFKARCISAPNENIKNSLMSYLTEYYVPGNWRSPSVEHLAAIEKRIYEVVEET
jgi:capsular polysaccharide export protein